MATGDYIITAILFLAGVIAFLIFVPKRQVRQVEKLEDRIALETGIRKTLAQILGGIILLAGLFFHMGSAADHPASSGDVRRNNEPVSARIGGRSIPSRFSGFIGLLLD